MGGLYRVRKWPPPLQDVSCRVDGQRAPIGRLRKGYAELDRRWSDGDVVELDLPMPVARVTSYPRVAANIGRVAMQRGPVVYCVEAVDHDGPVRDLLLPRHEPLVAEHRSGLLGGVTVLQGRAVRQSPARGLQQPAQLLAVPYGVWANREVGEMDVWIREAAERP
jgi:DUF1680 family protein